ncbi:hypothetical protein J0X14_18120 [Muricauda sp. CAU 1633]|uniref:hypothetical protein n=1 Tax=Allomuricauda sp. CAU 1633 TaxID=2816036 RepID=UPI001A8E947D|nr:hypothetical protein [Muricauda sp. CAU 1633]MBO0324232.1 hypothetical protein [Muricauda sp. CAU 1633]
MNDNEHLEKLVNELMEDASYEKPSHNFTDTVMKKIEALDKPSPIFKSVMPKWPIVVFVSILVLLAAYGVATNPSVEETTPFYTQEIDKVGQWLSYLFSKIVISKKALYTLSMIGIVIGLQTHILKKYFNSRLT